MPLAFNPSAPISGSGVIPWKVKSSDYTAEAGERILIDTSVGIWVLSLPKDAKPGDEIDLFGISGLESNPLTINLSDAKFENQALASLKLMKNDYVKLVYVGASIGWIASNKFNLEINLPIIIKQDLLLDKFPDAVLAYSFRRLSKNYQSNLARVGTNNIGFNSQGDLNINAIGGSITGWYDQSGNNLHSESNRPPILNKIDNKFVATFDNNAIFKIPAFENSLLFGSPLDISIFIILQAQQKTTTILDNAYPPVGQISWYIEANSSSDIGFENATSQGASLPSSTLNYANFSIISLVRDSTSLRVAQNGEDRFIKSFSPAIFTPRLSSLNIGSESGITPYFLRGSIAELIIYPKAMENYKDIIAEINTYYQFY